MNILLVYPKYPDTFWSFKHALKFISKKALHPRWDCSRLPRCFPEPLGETTHRHEYRYVRDRDLLWADYVFIGGMAVQKQSAKELIAQCREAKVQTVAGVRSLRLPRMTFRTSTTSCSVRPRTTLPRVPRGLRQGRSTPPLPIRHIPDLGTTPAPLWSLIKMRRYFSMNLQYSRGCPFQLRILRHHDPLRQPHPYEERRSDSRGAGSAP